MVTCPHCGSKNISYFEDRTYSVNFVLDKNNEPTDKIANPIGIEGCDYTLGAWGYYCNDCDWRFGGTMKED